METGKVEYATDYKSHKHPHKWRKEDTGPSAGVERARLEREVIEAAKEWRKRADDPQGLWVVSDQALIVKIDALLEFESSQLKK